MRIIPEIQVCVYGFAAGMLIPAANAPYPLQIVGGDLLNRCSLSRREDVLWQEGGRHIIETDGVPTRTSLRVSSESFRLPPALRQGLCHHYRCHM